MSRNSEQTSENQTSDRKPEQLPFRLKRQVKGTRYEVRGRQIRDMRGFGRFLQKDIFNIFLLSLIQTYRYKLTLIVGASLGSQVGKNLYSKICHVAIHQAF